MASSVTGLLCVGCGHCKALAPAYEEVSASFKGDENVSVSLLHGLVFLVTLYLFCV